MKTLVMGIKSKSDKIFEYSLDRNYVFELFSMDNCVADFALTVYQGTQVILTGGSDFLTYGKTKTWCFSCEHPE
jgi:hypothetical protein